MAREMEQPEAERLKEAVEAFRDGDEGSMTVIDAAVRTSARRAMAVFRVEGQAAFDDVEQETVLVVLRYLRQDIAFTGNLTSFAVAVARNRCRDILRWQKAHPHVPVEPLTDWVVQRSECPLDRLAAEETRGLLDRVIEALDPTCRQLLVAMYLARESAEDVRRRLGLETVQGVYYRRKVCLKKATELLNELRCERLQGSGESETGEAHGGATRGRE